MATMLKPEVDAVDPLDVSRAELYTEHRWHEPFRTLRAEAPVYWCADSKFGPYWSVSSYKAIQYVEALPDIYSSDWEAGGITIADRLEDAPSIQLPMFIAMDRPKHTEQRRTVAPAFTPSEMQRMGDDIRRRTGELLDTLPYGEKFDWVDKVSIELTTGMLALLYCEVFQNAVFNFF